MVMQVNGDYGHSRTGYAERVKEKQAAERLDETKEAEKAVEGKSPGKLAAPQDEYISSERPGKKPTGLYRVGQDGNGNRKIYFDGPKAAHANGEEELKSEEGRSGKSVDGKEPRVSGNGQSKPKEKCVTDTDKVDREIKKLKEKKQQLEQQIKSSSGDEKKIRELENKLAQVENELIQKDNDTYRRQNASVSE